MLDRAKIFFENSADLFGIVQGEHLRNLNPAWKKTLGWTVDDLTTRPLWGFVHPDDRTNAQRLLSEATASDFKMELRFIAKNGDYRWLQWHGNRIEHETYFIAREITEAKESLRSSTKLREKAFFFQRLIECTNDAVYLLSPSDGFKFVFVNPAACRHYHLPAEKLLGMAIPDWDPNFSLETCEEFWELLKKSKTKVLDTKHTLGSGKTIPVEVTANYLSVGGEEYIGGFIKDISERKRLDENMGHFAHAVSHDLSEPLRTIVSYLQLIQRRVSNDKEITEYVAFASDASKRMRELIKGLLDYTRLGHGLKTKVPTDLNQVLCNVEMNLRRKIDESGAQIIKEELPTVPGDPLLLGQVFQNLIDNAIKYRSEAPPRIQIGCKRLADSWEISVRDNGIGVSPENRERIFRVFQRLNHAQGVAGTGLGLATCKRLIELHEGKIEVESVESEGSVFRFTLPDHIWGSQPELSS